MPSYSELAARLLNFTNRELGAGLSDDDISAAERDIGVRIEGGYRQFLKQFGWGGVDPAQANPFGSGLGEQLRENGRTGRAPR